jgi:positive regulator of sigma E activity
MRSDEGTLAGQTDCRLTADAIVVAARPDGTVDLEFAPHPGCEGCAGTCLWKRLAALRLQRLRVDRALAPGAAVSVAIPGRQLRNGALATYGIPLGAILLGAAAGAAVSRTDLGTLTGALLALALVVAVFGRLRLRLEKALLSSLCVRPKP